MTAKEELLRRFKALGMYEERYVDDLVQRVIDEAVAAERERCKNAVLFRLAQVRGQEGIEVVLLDLLEEVKDE